MTLHDFARFVYHHAIDACMVLNLLLTIKLWRKS